MSFEVTYSQWAAVGLGAFVSWFIFNWISTPSPKKFTVKVPEGNSIVVKFSKIKSVLVQQTKNNVRFSSFVAADPKWTGKILENPSIRVNIIIIIFRRKGARLNH